MDVDVGAGHSLSDSGDDLPRSLGACFLPFPKARISRRLTSPLTVVSTSKSSSQQDVQPQKEKELPGEGVRPFSFPGRMPDRDPTHQGSTVARLRPILCFASSHNRANVRATEPLMLFSDCEFMFGN